MPNLLALIQYPSKNNASQRREGDTGYWKEEDIKLFLPRFDLLVLYIGGHGGGGGGGGKLGGYCAAQFKIEIGTDIRTPVELCFREIREPVFLSLGKQTFRTTHRRTLPWTVASNTHLEIIYVKRFNM